MKPSPILAAVLALLVMQIGAPHVEGAFPTVALKPVCLQQIHSPTTITYAPDGSGRVFVCDQPGKIYIIQGGMLLPTPFLNIASTGNAPPNNGPGPVIGVGTGYSERGLLGLAFHPGFANPLSPGYRKFYVNYNKAAGAGDPAPPQVGDPVNCVTVVSEFEVSATDPNAAVLGSERRVLAFTQPQNNHNGGQLEFGPDGMLYIGTGDGGSSNDNNAGHTGGSAARPTNGLGNSLDKTNYLGKVLRIDPIDPDGAGPLTYSIPASNPFVGAGGGVREEIYAFGLRNPWRFSFDWRPGGTNRLFCGDVGQGRIEEINLIVSGGNYGWRYKEGLEFPLFSSNAASAIPPGINMLDPLLGPYIDPIAMYAHPGAVTSPVLPQLGLSVTGGFVYRGAAIPAMQGKYIFGDYGSTGGASDGRIMGLEETAPLSGVFTLTQAIPLFGLANPIVGQRILTLGEDEAGEIYVGLRSTTGVLLLDGGLPAGGIYKIVPLAEITDTVPVDKDNTIFSEDIALARNYSDGLGYVYAGQTGPNWGPYVRRGLVSFNVSSVPSGAVVQSARLKLYLNKPGPSAASTVIDVHRLTETWGEGTSVNNGSPGSGTGAPATTNDATWLNRFYHATTPTPWTTVGGSYSATVSASSTVGGVGLMTWGPTAQLTSDVQGWVTTPASNAGWILIGDEVTELTACRFDSGETPFAGTPPALEITYLGFPPPTHYELWLATYYFDNLVGQFVDPCGDDDGDGIKNLFEYAGALSPLDYDSDDGFSVATEPGAAPGSTDVVVTFRRDTEATDLDYAVEITGDLVTWITIAESVAGGAATGLNGGTIDSDTPLDAVLNLVTVRFNLPAGFNARQFVRQRVDRVYD